jgi:hypothetical protein
MSQSCDESIYDESTLLKTDPVMNRSCDESTCNESAIQLKDSAIDRPSMNQTMMNRSCDESTLRWVNSVVKSSCASYDESTLQWVDPAMNWPFNESTHNKSTRDEITLW